MSYFLCLAFPSGLSERVTTSFDKRIFQTDASNFPIGMATRGKNASWKAVLLQIGSSSASLIGKAGVRRTHNNDHTGLFVAGIEALLEGENCGSISFLAHWMRGHIESEEVKLRDSQCIMLSGIQKVIDALEEDVRYTVSKSRYLLTADGNF